MGFSFKNAESMKSVFLLTGLRKPWAQHGFWRKSKHPSPSLGVDRLREQARERRACSVSPWNGAPVLLQKVPERDGFGKTDKGSRGVRR